MLAGQYPESGSSSFVIGRHRYHQDVTRDFKFKLSSSYLTGVFLSSGGIFSYLLWFLSGECNVLILSELMDFTHYNHMTPDGKLILLGPHNNSDYPLFTAHLKSHSMARLYIGRNCQGKKSGGMVLPCCLSWHFTNVLDCFRPLHPCEHNIPLAGNFLHMTILSYTSRVSPYIHHGF